MSHYEISHREREDEEEHYRHDFGPDEYAPAEVERESWPSEGAAPRPVGKHCVSCWSGLTSDSPGICGACGRPQDISEGEWLRLKYAPLMCEKCGRECEIEEEGFCSECGGQCKVAA